MSQTPIDFDAMVNPANLAFVEDLYYQFSQDPSSVDPAWRAYFQSLASDGAHAAAPPPQSFSRSIFAHRSNGHRTQTAPATIKVSSPPPVSAHGSNGGSNGHTAVNGDSNGSGNAVAALLAAAAPLIG